MKKTIQKPENWQDFETLCKQLWGEVWNIPMKIKKNGRNGQPQAGVDVYGVPKGELNYWGIQCKGKDDYVNAKLTKKEIDTEIEKAHNFKPDLSVFIFATTMNKDSNIEEYVRIKDLDSRKNGKFEILLFCWEDIADLIDDNQDTYNFWVGNKQHKTKFDFEVSLNDFQPEYIIKPKCVKTIKKYKVKEPEVEKLDMGIASVLAGNSWMHKTPFTNPAILSVSQGRINEAICSFETIMANIGSNVIEDWRVRFTVVGEHKEIMDHLGTGPMGMVDLNFIKNKRTYVNDNQITYSPRDNEPLIQKDNRYFEAYIIPKCKEYTIPIEWELLARDFNSSGKIYLKVEPEYEIKVIYEEVDSVDDLKEDEIVSIEEKKNYTDE
ncbi:hypothetical protein FNJ87_09405 [Nonlabens mediterrranea]|uniref:Mrr-like domain-containing protein n=1 Tax=Nonlabens mediterrranea TaxID=1419947 RepID=A0ABS0A6U4_9FLAO|nr:hypothetical protein [Nonlabens mediterrranea]